MRIDDADAVPGQEPDSSIGRLGDLWVVVAGIGKTPHAIGVVKKGDVDCTGRILAFVDGGSPGVQVRNGQFGPSRRPCKATSSRRCLLYAQ